MGGSSVVQKLTITNGSIRSSGGLGDGIDAGRAERDFAASLVSELTILNGTINAVGSSVAGIGAGYGGSSGHSSVGSLKILNGTIVAIGTAGAGIGSGDGYFGNSTLLALAIQNGDISAESVSAGAGIGAGYASPSGVLSVDSLAIQNGRLNAAGSSRPGIGGSTSLSFSGATEINSRSTADSFPIDAASVLLSAASVTARVPNSRVFGRSPATSVASDVSLLYGTTTSRGEEPLSAFSAHFLQVRRISFPAAAV
jgi:hypothetical protein